MVRFLTIACLCMAILVALCGLASRFTVTVTIRPIESPSAPTQLAPEAPRADVSPEPKPASKRVDSHHTKGA